MGESWFYEGMIPVWGAGRDAIDNFQSGDYSQAVAYAALAVTDVFLVRSAIKAIGKLGARAAAKGGSNLVYQGFDKAGVVRYVGITEREAAVRFGEHLSSGTAKSLLRYEVVPGATNLSRTGARVWEQTLINQYGLQKNGGLLLNKINSIAPKNWWQYGIKEWQEQTQK